MDVSPPRVGGCGLCGRPANVSLDPMSMDCGGGDCWGCMCQIEADMFGDPESIALVAKEIRWGWREADGSPKPQAFFLNGNPSFIHVRWLHNLNTEPVELWSELNAQREEVRKLEIWQDGRIGYAVGKVEVGGSRLSEGTVPYWNDIAHKPEFELQEISRFAFETCWDSKVGAHRNEVK